MGAGSTKALSPPSVAAASTPMASTSPATTRPQIDKFVSPGTAKRSLKIQFFASTVGALVGFAKGAKAGDAVKRLTQHDMGIVGPIAAYLLEAQQSTTLDPMANMVMAARSLSFLPGLLAEHGNDRNKLAHTIATLKDFLVQAEFVFGDLENQRVDPQETGLRMQILLAARHQFCTEQQINPGAINTADRWSQEFPDHAARILQIAQRMLASQPKIVSEIVWPEGYTPYSPSELDVSLHLVAGYRDPVLAFLGMGSDEPKTKSGSAPAAKSDVAVAQTDFHRLQALTPGRGATAVCCDALELAMKAVQNGDPHAADLLRPEVRLLTDITAFEALQVHPAALTPDQYALEWAWIKKSADLLGESPKDTQLCDLKETMNACRQAVADAQARSSAARVAYRSGQHGNDAETLKAAMEAASAVATAAQEALGAAVKNFVAVRQSIVKELTQKLAARISNSQHPEVAALGREVCGTADVSKTLVGLRDAAQGQDSLLWSPARRNVAGQSQGSIHFGKEVLSLMMWDEAVAQAQPGNTITETDPRWQDAQQHAWLQQAALQLSGVEQTKILKDIEKLYGEKAPSDSDIQQRIQAATKLIATIHAQHKELPEFKFSSMFLDLDDEHVAADLARAMLHQGMFEHRKDGTIPRAKLPKRGDKALATVAKLCIAEVVMARQFVKKLIQNVSLSHSNV